jgi:hypothetical protein
MARTATPATAPPAMAPVLEWLSPFEVPEGSDSSRAAVGEGDLAVVDLKATSAEAEERADAAATEAKETAAAEDEAATEEDEAAASNSATFFAASKSKLFFA